MQILQVDVFGEPSLRIVRHRHSTDQGVGRFDSLQFPKDVVEFEEDVHRKPVSPVPFLAPSRVMNPFLPFRLGNGVGIG